MKEKLFQKEADLCAAFIAEVTNKKGWRAYCETGGFDILLVREADGLQIGIEAKLSFNLKVLTQALPDCSKYSHALIGPDHRAVLVPSGETQLGLKTICDWLGITVISLRDNSDGNPRRYQTFSPDLPSARWNSCDWHYWAPLNRCSLPDYVPDVGAGHSSPIKLSDWKIAAIKLMIVLDERPVSRADFKALQLSPTRWLDPWTGWLVLVPGTKTYIAGPHLPDFKAQHPINYAEIAADKEKWMQLHRIAAIPVEQIGLAI